ncbi:MAG: ABC transporter permease [Actinocatenispora sp.]
MTEGEEATMTATAERSDERLADVGIARRLLGRPELGSLIGAALVLVFFSLISDVFRSPAGVANWLDPASTLGIMAVAVAMLMIGGEFDLSAGVMTGSVGLWVTILATRYDLNVWVAVLVALCFALLVGFLNGYVVVRTGLPSFIITLGTFLVLQGLNLGVTKFLTGTVLVGGLTGSGGFSSAHFLFASSVVIGGVYFKVSIVWWIVLTAIATLALLRTRFGNWTFAVGGDVTAARNVGVPAARTKISLFMVTTGAAWLVGTMTALRLTSTQANQGVGDELIYIVAAVIGGCLLTGGFGSAIGAALGALIFGMTSVGIVYAGWDADWFKFFLGAMLLLAVFANRLVRRYAERNRR